LGIGWRVRRTMFDGSNYSMGFSRLNGCAYIKGATHLVEKAFGRNVRG